MKIVLNAVMVKIARGKLVSDLEWSTPRVYKRAAAAESAQPWTWTGSEMKVLVSVKSKLCFCVMNHCCDYFPCVLCRRNCYQNAVYMIFDYFPPFCVGNEARKTINMKPAKLVEGEWFVGWLGHHFFLQCFIIAGSESQLQVSGWRTYMMSFI